MKIKFIIIVALLIAIGISCKTTEKQTDSRHSIKIKWIDNLEGDFSFKEKWSYQEGVYKNRHGQLSCDGFCPIEIDPMKDASGKIYQDSLQAFYKIIDTTHSYHSLKSDNRMYEYFGTNFIEFQKTKDGNIKGESVTNASTHSSLLIEIQNDSCAVWVDFNSIRDLGQHIFPLESGTISIDRKLFKEGILKGVFNFNFKNTLEPNENLFWKGQIYSIIETK